MAIPISTSELINTLNQINQEFYKYKIEQEKYNVNTTATEVYTNNNYWIQKPARKENIRYLNKPEVRDDKA